MRSPANRPSAHETVTRAGGLIASILYAVVIAWLLVGQPRSVAEVSGGLTAQVGLYQVHGESFEEGLRFFRADKFEEARLAFARADPALRDAVTQFYVAYAYYRQGWGRFYQDDALFREAVAALDRAERAASGRVVVRDPGLGLQSSDELRAELQRGLTRDVSDFNPMRVFRPRR